MLRYFKYKLDSGIQNLVLKTLLTAKAQREKISRVLSGGNRRSVVSQKLHQFLGACAMTIFEFRLDASSALIP